MTEPDYNLLLDHYKIKEVSIIKQINKNKRIIGRLNERLDDVRDKKEKCIERLKKGK